MKNKPQTGSEPDSATNGATGNLVDEQAEPGHINEGYDKRCTDLSKPILDIEDLRQRVAAKGKLEDYKYFEFENLPASMVFQSMSAALVQVMVVTGAYYFMQTTGANFTPQCKRYHAGVDMSKFGTDKTRMNAYACYVTVFAFWTYPLCCPIAVIAVYWKNLLDRRLFYECMINRIFLCFPTMSYLHSPVFWFLLTYLACGLSAIFYIKDSPTWEVRPFHELIFGIFAYLSPITAFMIVLFTHFSANADIVTLPNFIARDREKAVALLNECTYIRDKDFRIAFRRAEHLIEELASESRILLTLDTPELMQLVLDQHEKRTGSTFFEEVDCDAACRCYKAYWVTSVLYMECLNDWRAWRFRFFARFYMAFMVLAVLVYVYALLYTLHKVVGIQRADPRDIIPAPEKIYRDVSSQMPHHHFGHHFLGIVD